MAKTIFQTKGGLTVGRVRLGVHGSVPGSVAQEVQKGYQRGERALRPARVVVARAGAA